MFHFFPPVGFREARRYSDPPSATELDDEDLRRLGAGSAPAARQLELLAGANSGRAQTSAGSSILNRVWPSIA